MIVGVNREHGKAVQAFARGSLPIVPDGGNRESTFRGWRANGAESDGLTPSIGAGLRGGVVLVV